MDFHEFGIDPRLASAIENCGISQFLFEKMLSRSLKDGEDVCAKMTLDDGREEVLLLPALQWILSASDQEKRKVLVVSHESGVVGRLVDTARRIGGETGIEAAIALSESLDGSADAALVAGTPESLIDAGERGLVNLREFGFLVVDGADVLAERPPELMRKLAGILLPSWERRSILACSRITVKAKNLAWDLADNPLEISIEGEVAKAQSVAKETWRVATEAKLRFLLGLIEREKPGRLCVFCNLRDTAEELSGRLGVNGILSDYLLGALAVDRKLSMLAKIEAKRGAALVLTDKGAEGLPSGRFPLVVNYDFPLEPELFVSRLEMLDRSAEGARVISLACDRYIYGLPAVEQYIDEKLEAAQADESMLAAEDKSAGLAFERKPAERDGRAPDDRRQGRNGGRDERNRREGGRRDSYSREDRGPDIRRSIAEATGGSLDVGGEGPIERPRAAASIQGGGRRDDRGDGRGNRGDGRGNRGDGKGNRGDGRGNRVAQAEGKRGKPRPNAGERSSRDDLRSVNPYELSMEERMRRYREKYGQRVMAPSGRSSPTATSKPGERTEGDGLPG